MMRLSDLLRAAMLGVAAAVSVTACATGVAGLANHPDELVFGERELTFLDREDYRHELPGVDVMYVVTDRALPLVKMRIYSRARRLPARGSARRQRWPDRQHAA